jgi:hypothetical protein
MRATNRVIAIACSDIHLNYKPPIARAGEKSWWKAMKRPLHEIRDLQYKFNCPVICAGDIFHHWKAPPELINFALDNLPDMLTVAGQHDLPMHRLDRIRQSAIYTLARAGKVQMIESEWLHRGCRKVPRPSVAFYSWEEELQPVGDHPRKGLCIAVQHRFVWMNNRTYPGAPKDGNVRAVAKELHKLGYNIGVFGDNHKGFIWKDPKTDVTIVNCGAMMRRAIDEVDETPFVTLIFADGTVKKHHLDISKDVIAKPSKDLDQKQELDLHDFLASLEDLSSTPFDFVEAMKQALERDNVSKPIRAAITKAIDHARSK